MHQTPTPPIVRCGISYDRQPSYEPGIPYDDAVDCFVASAAGIALIHGILTHYCGYGFYEVDEMLLPISPSMADSVIPQMEKHFKIDDVTFTCAVPIHIQTQTDAPRICVSCNVIDEIKTCEVYPYPTILSASQDTGISVIQGIDSRTYLFPKIGDSIICVMSEEQPDIAIGGTWDDMHYDMLPPMSNDFFQVFIKYLVAIVCYGDKKYQSMHLSSGFPQEYLHPVFQINDLENASDHL